MSYKYEPLPLNLCQMLEQEFKEVHKLPYKADWLLEENQIKGKEDDEIKRNKNKIIEALDSSIGLKYSEIKEKLYDVDVIPITAVADLVSEDRSLVIIALVGNNENLHIRIFDANGGIVVDKAEKDLTSGETLEKLKEQCKSLLKPGNKPALLPEKRLQIIQDATSIAGHTLALGLTTENLCSNLNKLLQQCSKNRSLLYHFKHLPSEELLPREEMQLREMANYLDKNREPASKKLKEEDRESTSKKLENDFIQVNRLLLEAAFPNEIESIYEWRLKNIWKKIHDLPISEQHPSSLRSALCLSGGGIRSASFALGIIQGLARYRLLGKFDYLSTVSGGGYIGSWLTAWLYHQGKNGKNGIDSVTQELSNKTPPARLEPASKPIQFLREYSNFITPEVGLFTADTWAFVAIYIRNLIVNWLAIIPLLLALLALPRVYAAGVNSIVSANTENLPWFLVWIGLAMLCFPVICVAINKPGSQDTSKAKNQSEAEASQSSRWSRFINFIEQQLKQQLGILLAGLLPLVIAATCLTLFSVPWLKSNPAAIPGWILYVVPLLVVAIGWGIARWKDFNPKKLGILVWEIIVLLLTTAVTLTLTFILVGWGYPMQKYLDEVCNVSLDTIPIFTVIAIPLFLAICLFGITFFVALSTRLTSLLFGDDVREWWGRAGGWILIAGLGWLALSALVIFGPVLLAEVPGWISGIGGVAGIVTLILGRSGRIPATSEQSRKLSLLDRILTHIAMVAAILFLIVFFIFLSWLTSWLLNWLFNQPLSGSIQRLNYFQTIVATPWQSVFYFFLVMLIIGLLWAFAIDLNKFSLHEAYRNRLIRVFLGASNADRKPNPFTGFDPTDNIQMHNLRSIKPMPVVNMALNVVRGDRLAWQERKAEPFCVTPLYSGCCFLGYRKSEKYATRKDDKKNNGKDNKKGISLGTAITISGAAVSPNMGYSSSPILALALMLLNVRLGWWLGNPGIHGQDSFYRPAPRLSLTPLLAEGFGLANDRRKYVYLSDGGHFDNLGLYEMVLRRCHLIVISDASQDGEHTFEDLANAVRKIRIDLGVEITFDHEIPIYPRDPEKKAGNWAIKEGGYAAIGRIQYSVMDGENVPDGILIYLKPAIYGSEPRDILQYARTHPEFPHESTADQFFSESQFESYRRLGYYVINTICGEEQQEHRLSSFIQKAISYAYGPDKTPQWLPSWLNRL